MLLSLAEVEQTLVHIALINTDKTTFILGIGIGRACARALAKDGAAGLLIADIDTSAAQETAAQCQEVATNRHFRVETTRVDITDEMSVVTATSVTIRVFAR
jgi:NAD(P)-dependent dehydrogenase (short-subunit alcohol dehydrogenase family)